MNVLVSSTFICFVQSILSNISILLDELNDANVSPVNLRIDFPKGESPPIVTVKLEDRVLGFATHALDVIIENLEEIHTAEEKRFRKTHPRKFVPIDIHLKNVQLALAVRPAKTMFTFCN